MPEYLPWYQAGVSLLRCQECAALLLDGDIEVHTDWHERVRRIEEASTRLSEKINYINTFGRVGGNKGVGW